MTGLLGQIMQERIAHATKYDFINKIHSETGIPVNELSEAYDKGGSYGASKLEVYTLVEANKQTDPRRRNLVAKNDFNKAAVHKNREKNKLRNPRKNTKHKGIKVEGWAENKAMMDNYKKVKELSNSFATDALQQTPDFEEAIAYAVQQSSKAVDDNEAKAWKLAADKIHNHAKNMDMKYTD